MRVVVVVIVASLFAGCPSVESYYRSLDGADVQLDINYAGDELLKHNLDWYAPRGGRDATGRYPVVVFVHGGYWRGGDKNLAQGLSGLYGNVGASLTELGIGAVITNYRLFPGATFEQMLDDVVAAMRWTRDHAERRGADPNAIFIAGHSAGGHIVSYLGTHPDALASRGFAPDLLRGVVSISGIYDIPANAARVSPELRDEVFLPLFGKDEAAQLQASPKAGFGRQMTPTLFIAGEHDYPGCLFDHLEAQKTLAPLEGERAFFATIAGNTHEDMVVEIGTKHDEVTPRIAAFVRYRR